MNSFGVKYLLLATFRSESGVLCSKNKSEIDPAKKQGIYKYVCPKCGKVYIGQTHQCCKTRWREHQHAFGKGDWTHSGISQHHQNCDEPFDVSSFQVIKNMTGNNKKISATIKKCGNPLKKIKKIVDLGRTWMKTGDHMWRQTHRTRSLILWIDG